MLLIVTVICVLQTRSLLGRLAKSTGCADSSELFKLHTLHVLRSMDNSYETWTQHSSQRLVFDALILEAGQLRFSVLFYCSFVKLISQFISEIFQTMDNSYEM